MLIFIRKHILTHNITINLIRINKNEIIKHLTFSKFSGVLFWSIFILYFEVQLQYR